MGVGVAIMADEECVGETDDIGALGKSSMRIIGLTYLLKYQSCRVFCRRVSNMSHCILEVSPYKVQTRKHSPYIFGCISVISNTSEKEVQRQLRLTMSETENI